MITFEWNVDYLHNQDYVDFYKIIGRTCVLKKIYSKLAAIHGNLIPQVPKIDIHKSPMNPNCAVYFVWIYTYSHTAPICNKRTPDVWMPLK